MVPDAVTGYDRSALQLSIPKTESPICHSESLRFHVLQTEVAGQNPNFIMRNFLNKLLPRAYGLYFNILSVFAKKETAQKAFYLFATVRKGRVLEHQKQYLDHAKKDCLRIADHDIQTYQWSGKGSTVLLVHGWESNTFRWRNLIAKLKAADLNVVAFDAPGHGYSSGQKLHVPLYAEVLQFLIDKYRPKYLVSHSVGGMTVLYSEYVYPDPDIEKIVTVASPSEFHEIMEHFQNLLKFNDRVLKALDAYVYDKFGFRIREFSTSEFAKTNTKKGLLFHDKWDKITPHHASQKVHADWKGSRLVSTEGLGHSMHQDEVNDAIVDFLKL
jgi:pimeloyl-ACP methyl ester carboxylesterase